MASRRAAAERSRAATIPAGAAAARSTRSATSPKMSASDRKRVLIFGTSANPPTGRGGHTEIVRDASTHDEVWVLPVYRHAYADKDLAPYADRLAMAHLAFDPIPNVFVKET